MTDKQIIIDVTQCPYHKEDKICTYLPYKSKCEGDCNWTAYKEMEEKLKAKEQECEELKNIIETKLEDANICDSALNYINDEYIYVKRQLDQLKAQLLDQEAETLKAGGIIHKLEKTLTEIKEIAENAYCLTNGTNKDMAQFAKQILQKISECEGNDEN